MYFFEQLEKEAWDMRRLLAGKAQIKIAAIGSATAAALKEHGLFADIVPKIYNAGELGKTLAENISEYSAVTIFRAEEGSLELLPPLMETGVPVNDIALYRTEYEVSSLLRHKIEKMFQKEEIDAVTFTSASTVKGFVKAIKKRRTSKCVCRLYRRTNSGRSKEIRNEDSSRKTGGYGCNDREDCGMFRKCEFLKI